MTSAPDARQAVIDAFDRFIDTDELEPLTEAIGQLRLSLKNESLLPPERREAIERRLVELKSAIGQLPEADSSRVALVRHHNSQLQRVLHTVLNQGVHA